MGSAVALQCSVMCKNKATSGTMSVSCFCKQTKAVIVVKMTKSLDINI